MTSLRRLLCRLTASLPLACPTIGAETVSAIYRNASEVPVEASGYVATGKTVAFTLDFAPVPGTRLTVVRQSGLPWIQGTFDNLAQGQPVELTHAGITYRFVANYFGGTGNDLVLQWADTRVFAWGSNNRGALGTGFGTSSLARPVIATGVLAGKTVVQVAAGGAHSLALCSDGTVASWGYGYYGQVGNSYFYDTSSPVAVKLDGALSGKTVIAIAAGNYHSLALCTDGSVAAWGNNSSGQLGNGTTLDSSVPVIVSTSGVLAGKTVVAIGTGQSHSLALCSDGTVAGWGSNSGGQLGNGSSGTVRLEPVAAYRGGILAGKTVTALKGGNAHTLALCADGTLAAWGSNSRGQLGINSLANQILPVQVIQTGALAGKTVVGIGCGNTHSLAVCSDGSMAGWGNNGTNQLASGSTSNKLAPVTMVRSGSLTGKTVIALDGAPGHTLGLSPDGTLSAWGYNVWGQLGNGTTTTSASPVAVSTVNLRAGERFVAGSTSHTGQHCLGLAASLPPPTVLTSGATAVHATGATLNGSVNAAGAIATGIFEYGTTNEYNRSISATPSAITGTATTAVSAAPSDLLPGTTYHYRLVASNENGTATGEDRTFTTSVKAALAGLHLSDGTALPPSYFPATTRFFATVPHSTASIAVTPFAADPSALVRVNGAALSSGGSSAPLPLAPGDNSISLQVESADGLETLIHTLTVHRLPERLRFESDLGSVARSGGFSLAGITAELELGFAPRPGAGLTLLDNSGLDPIRGEFQNLPHGRLVLLEHGTTRYAFVANYHGGSGNDLVLEWAHQRVMSWGSGEMGQLGNNSTVRRLVPGPVSMGGALAGKTITAAALGEYHNLVLRSDGSLAAWGLNDYGQLGFDGGSTYFSGLPVAVAPSGALVGKRVVAIQAGGYHSLALCSDGTLAAWGLGTSGQLGNGANGSSPVPVAVVRDGALAGKQVLAIAAAFDSNLALCSDGTLVSWGSNQHGQLGTNRPGNRNVPVKVSLTGALAGKSVVSIHAGGYHYLALCSDGSLAAWGYNNSNQLGNNSTLVSSVPVSVDLTSGLAGKAIGSVVPMSYGNLALCADGALAGWGDNTIGQLGPAPDFFIPAPRLIAPAGALVGKSVVRLAAGGGHGLAQCSDGSLAAWGYNGEGRLGNNTTVSSSIPVAVSSASLHPGERFSAAFATSFHNLALTGLPPPVAITSAASSVTGAGARLNGQVNAQGHPTAVWFELGLDTSYGTKVPAGPATVSAVGNSSVSALVAGLSPGTTYHYRVVADGDRGGNTGPDLTFTTSRPPEFAGYTFSTPFETPATLSSRKLLGKASDPDGDTVSLSAAGPASARGGSATWQASGILYTPPPGFSGTDTFPVTLSDSRGTSATALVTALVGPDPAGGGMGSNPPVLTPLPGGAIALLFHGIPGRSYHLQRTTDMSLWTTLSTVTADPKGAVHFTDPDPPQPSAFYRLSEP
jgi:alpha-tubulin suppressor-like RCC1 family protein